MIEHFSAPFAVRVDGVHNVKCKEGPKSNKGRGACVNDDTQLALGSLCGQQTVYFNGGWAIEYTIWEINCVFVCVQHSHSEGRQAIKSLYKAY